MNNQEDTLTRGQRIAGGIAKFGGSWVFIFTFAAIVILLITINVLSLFQDTFDPYPFILLNLVLSCLAAIIMMSQNRQEDRDRSQSIMITKSI